jgi:putative PIN family toxin of toxin-antitoxin system
VSRAPVVIDTNVVVAGLLTADPSSPVARILDGMLSAAFPFVISEALLAEYSTVLVRPAVRRRHGLTGAEIDLLLVDIARHAIVLVAGTAPRAPDPGDQFLWNLLASRDDLLLVTGDQALQAAPTIQGRVTSPRAFVDSL